MSLGSSAGNRASVPRVGLRELPAGGAMRLAFAPRGFVRKKFGVLVAHDLTAASEIALVRAARLAAEREGQLTILHVIDSALSAAAIEAARAHASKHLEAEARRWLPENGLPYRIDIGIGDPAGAVAARAQAHGVDLIVAGRRQCNLRGAFTSRLVGRLLGRTQRPILVVGTPNQSPYRRILMPIDLTPASAAGARFVASFLPQASVHLLHASKRSLRDALRPLTAAIAGGEEEESRSGSMRRQREQAVSSFVETLDLGARRPRVSIEEGDPRHFIADELARKKTDLLVVGRTAAWWKEPPFPGVRTGNVAVASCDILFPSIGAPT